MIQKVGRVLCVRPHNYISAYCNTTSYAIVKLAALDQLSTVCQGGARQGRMPGTMTARTMSIATAAPSKKLRVRLKYDNEYSVDRLRSFGGVARGSIV